MLFSFVHFCVVHRLLDFILCVPHWRPCQVSASSFTVPCYGLGVAVSTCCLQAHHAFFVCVFFRTLPETVVHPPLSQVHLVYCLRCCDPQLLFQSLVKPKLFCSVTEHRAVHRKLL